MKTEIKEMETQAREIDSAWGSSDYIGVVSGLLLLVVMGIAAWKKFRKGK